MNFVVHILLYISSQMKLGIQNSLMNSLNMSNLTEFL